MSRIIRKKKLKSIQFKKCNSFHLQSPQSNFPFHRFKARKSEDSSQSSLSLFHSYFLQLELGAFCHSFERQRHHEPDRQSQSAFYFCFF